MIFTIIRHILSNPGSNTCLKLVAPLEIGKLKLSLFKHKYLCRLSSVFTDPKHILKVSNVRCSHGLKILYPAESVSPLRGHLAQRNWSRTPCRLPLAPLSERTHGPASDVRSGTSLAPKVQQLHVSHPGFEPEVCPLLRERAANRRSPSELQRCGATRIDFGVPLGRFEKGNTL